MNKQVVSLEGLTYERLRALLELEFNLKNKYEELEKKEQELKEKYKIGTYEFIFTEEAFGGYGPKYQRFIETKKDSETRLKTEIESHCNRNNNLIKQTKSLREENEGLRQFKKELIAENMSLTGQLEDKTKMFKKLEKIFNIKQ